MLKIVPDPPLKAPDGNGELVWGVHYLSGMAKALVEDVAHGMMTVPIR